MSSRSIYRRTVDPGSLITFTIVSGQTDLLIRATHDLRPQALASVARHRQSIETYLHIHPRFATSLQPTMPSDDAPPIVHIMSAAGNAAGTGPMSAVAGAVAAAVGTDLLSDSDEVIVENGGDLFIHTLTKRTVSLYAASSPLSGRIGISIGPQQTMGVCTSTGSFGHSLSLGKADTCTVVAPSAALADAVATAMGNLVRTADDLSRAVDMAADTPGVAGAIAIIGDRMAVRGQITLVSLQESHYTG